MSSDLVILCLTVNILLYVIDFFKFLDHMNIYILILNLQLHYVYYFILLLAEYSMFFGELTDDFAFLRTCTN